MAHTLMVIGVGNEMRGDDAVGLIVARRLAEINLSDVVVVEQSGEGAALMDLFDGVECAYLVDAVRAGGEAGTVYRFEAHREALPANFFNYSTHAFSVAEAVEMARSLGRLPGRLVVYGIEGARFEAGSGVSDAVESAAQSVLLSLRDELINS